MVTQPAEQIDVLLDYLERRSAQAIQQYEETKDAGLLAPLRQAHQVLGSARRRRKAKYFMADVMRANDILDAALAK